MTMEKLILFLAIARSGLEEADLAAILLSSKPHAAEIVLNKVLDGLPGVPPSPLSSPTHVLEVGAPALPVDYILEMRPHESTDPCDLYRAVKDALEPTGLEIPCAFLVYEIVQIPYQRYWPDGERTRGPKLMVLARRRHDVDPSVFADRWRQHALLAWRIHIGMWRYTQNFVRERWGGLAQDTDGVAVTHYRSTEDYLTRQYEHESHRKEILDDVTEFVSSADHFVTEERILRSTTPKPLPHR